MKVHSITAKSVSSSQWTIHSDSGSADYKAVIIAAPLHDAAIDLPAIVTSQIPEQASSSLHVTVLTTTSPAPSPEYFALPASSPLPHQILTTYEGVRRGGKEPDFFSLSYHGLVRDGEWAVRILSKEPISEEWLAKVFSGRVGWVYRKEVCFLTQVCFPIFASLC
jgi:prenylcysteine oxidase / farnesylcysteine lyase